MIGVFGRAARQRRAAEPLNLALARQARDPVFFSVIGVPDSLDGRFDLAILHLWLGLRRLRGQPEGSAERGLAQGLFDAAFLDFDRALRELGVADLGVGRRIKQMTHAYNGRVQSYDEALSAPAAEALDAALRRNVWGNAPRPPDPAAITALAAYVRASDAVIATLPLAALAAGQIPFPALPDRLERVDAA